MQHREMIQNGLLAAMRHSTEPMVLSDPHAPDMPILAANAAFEALTLYSEAEIVGRNCRFLQGPRTDSETVRRMGALLRDGQGCVQWVVNYRKDGSTFWNLLFISPVFGADGSLLFMFANQHNLSAGSPLALDEFPLGVVHMPPQQQAEFHLVLQSIVQDEQDAASAGSAVGRALALEATLAAARQVAFMSMRLSAGPGPVA
jgi:PAS domain S-box-containing protein